MEQKEPSDRALDAAREIARIMRDERYTTPLKQWMVAMRVQQEIDRAGKAAA
jgi:hypothetical protein